MRFKIIFEKISLALILFLFYSCGPKEEGPIGVDFSKIIAGKWIQTKSFDLVDFSKTPPEYDWFDVENGFILELNPDNSFTYTKYGSCNSGSYIFDTNSLKINFLFDCEFELNGKSMNQITVQIDDSASDESTLFIDHFNENQERINVFSVLSRVK